MNPLAEGRALVLKIHADAGVVVPGSPYVDPSMWGPLIFRNRPRQREGARLRPRRTGRGVTYRH